MRILTYTSPARGHLYPTVPILLELQRRGHEIFLHTMAAEVDRMRGLGFTVTAIDSRIEAIPFDDYLANSTIGAIKRALRTSAARSPYEIEDVQGAIAAETPDALLMDGNADGAVAAAEAWGGPWAFVQHFPTPVPAPEVPPFGPGFPPARGAAGRLRDRMLRPVILGSFERILLPPLNEGRQRLGLRPVRDVTDVYTRAPLTLYLTSKAFEYPRETWPDSFCLTGPILWDPPAEPPEWLDSAHRPVVLVTTSSEFQNDGALVDTALAGLADEDCTVVATLPSGSLPHNVPANAHVEGFVPHTPLLEVASVAVTHGGMGATQKALCAGVPVVVVPWGRDQAEVGRRAEVAGVGVMLSKKKLSPSSVRDAVAHARTLAPKAAAFAEAMRLEGGAALAADRFEQLAAQHTTPHTRAA